MAYALPAANHTCAKEIRTLLGSEPVLDDGVVGEEFVKLGDELLELTEHQERAVFRPCRAGSRISGLPKQNGAGRKVGLAGHRVRREAVNCGVRDPVKEPKVYEREVNYCPSVIEPDREDTHARVRRSARGELQPPGSTPC